VLLLSGTGPVPVPEIFLKNFLESLPYWKYRLGILEKRIAGAAAGRRAVLAGAFFCFLFRANPR
jgi:hypothetical protein